MLLLVHLLIAAHIAWWLASGSTLTPVEPSESMQTLELGLVNAGFIFFCLAILSTLFFGRFFCGWACHVIALQDLCGWIMKKCGVRPHPFRSRLLVTVPFLLALYMFVWPAFKRLVLAPALESWWPTIRADLAINPFPVDGFTLHLVTEGFWDTFAPPLIAIPFLLVCGFATVYFLGAKGFCTYGCPYGGFFAPVERLSPARIVVDHDKCHQCGHCTAVCTSNVRVSDEVREFGMVVDPGCMKCLDCVSVCPNSALSFGYAKPSLLKGKPRKAAIKRVYDTTILEDIALAFIFLATFLGTRGAYGVIPMLMAIGVAGCATFIAWKAWRIIRDPNVRFSVFQFKRARRLTPAGIIFLAITLLGIALTAHTGVVNYHRWLGESTVKRLALSKNRLLDPGAPPLTDAELSDARSALAHFTRSSSFRDGGIGLASMPSSDLSSALLALALKDYDLSESLLRRVLDRAGPGDELIADLGRVIIARDRADAPSVIALYEQALKDHPAFWGVREALLPLLLQTGGVDQAIAEATEALTKIPAEKWTARAHARTLLTLSRLQAIIQQNAVALSLLRKAVEIYPADPALHENLAVAVLQIEGDIDAALAHAYAALKLAPSNLNLRFQIALLELQRNQPEVAIKLLDDLERRDPGNIQRRATAAAALKSAGRAKDARRFE